MDLEGASVDSVVVGDHHPCQLDVLVFEQPLERAVERLDHHVEATEGVLLQLCQVFMEAMPRFVHAPNGTPVWFTGCSQIVYKWPALETYPAPGASGAHQLEAANPADGMIMAADWPGGTSHGFDDEPGYAALAASTSTSERTWSGLPFATRCSRGFPTLRG